MNIISSLKRLVRPPSDQPSLLYRVLPGALVALLLGLLVLVLELLGIHLPQRFWQLLGLALLLLGVLWWFLRGSKRLSRRGLARKRLGDLGPGNPEDEAPALAGMQRALQQTRQNIARSPEMASGRDPLYRIPWLLFIGDETADSAGLLRSAGHLSPFPPAGDDPQVPDPVWRWHFFKSMLAIETSPRLVCDPQQRLERGLWYQALQLLADERDKLPLNGIVLCVGAETLRQEPEAVRPVAMRLRRLVDEALEHLQIQMPVYLLVTGLERLPGSTEFLASLPNEALQRALGHRLPSNVAITEATSERLDGILAPIRERLHGLRISALREQSDATGRHAIWSFVESLKDLEPSLHTLVKLLLEDNPFQHTLLWRGLYFSAATAPGLPASGAFLADLFRRFLPADQPLASPSLRSHGRRLGIVGLGVAALLALSLALGSSLSGMRRDDQQLLAQTRSACQASPEQGAAGRIAWLSRCGHTIEQLESSHAQAGLGFGLRRADADIEQLKERVREDFSNLILAPYDQLLETDLNRGQAGLEHMLAISQRLRLLQRCRRQNPQCLGEQLSNQVFDPKGRLFSPFFSGDQNAQADRKHAADLLTTYLGYLRWQRNDLLDAEAERLQSQLKRTLGAYRTTLEDLQRWAEVRHDGLILTDFWLPADRKVGVDDSLARISAAYTAPIWQQVVAPLLDSVKTLDPTALEDFRHLYLQRYQREWALFESRFFEGVMLWKGDYDELARRAASHENPYRQLFRETRRHLDVLPLRYSIGERWRLALGEARQDWLGAWHPLWRFTCQTLAGMFAKRLETPAAPWWQAQQQALPALQAQQPVFNRAWLLLNGEGQEQALYRIAAELFRSQGQASDGPAAEQAALLRHFEQPDSVYAGQFSAEDQAAWQVMRGPARLLLFLTLQRSAELIERHWREKVVTQLERLPAADRLPALYGEQGRLEAFVRDWLEPFVSQGERAPLQLAGLSLPLSAGYTAMIAGEQRLQPLLNSTAPFPAGSFRFTRPSLFGSRPEGPLGSQLEIDCKERLYIASSNAESLADARVQVFWSAVSCPQIRLRIALPLAETPEPLEPPLTSEPATVKATWLTRLYSGVEGLLQLLGEFRSGAHSFALSDFRTAYSAAQWKALQPQLSGIGAVRVHLEIQLSDELKRFIAVRNSPTHIPLSILD
ncbi:type VI secretion protein IcmF/TssM N-terminal domain-containing protein [Azotobacter chroococcum]|uniref:type VI secretion protein IcmF/TssM N-terminal domain-containing protein n=1 Tax=Azotobacter chroococcum TaxID=353 RepID=UPI0010ADBC9E|nr:type VI secretion protein IcmF/TssM N-terminal domain-containing protein [Azotobacter chroococcum]TKD29908.1 hypothetical protein FCG41_24770 [Azotobacter chroococcum]